MRLPEVTGHPLPEVLAAGIIDPDLFRTGYAIMAARYEELGIRALLPQYLLEAIDYVTGADAPVPAAAAGAPVAANANLAPTH